MNLSTLIIECLKDVLCVMDQVLAENDASYYGIKPDSFSFLNTE